MSAEEASETQATSPSSSSEAALQEMSSDDGSSSDEEELSPTSLARAKSPTTRVARISRDSVFAPENAVFNNGADLKTNLSFALNAYNALKVNFHASGLHSTGSEAEDALLGVSMKTRSCELLY